MWRLQGKGENEELFWITLMTNLIDYEPFTFEEVASQQVWKDTMLEEY